MASVFTKIINREIIAKIIYETENVIAFLDAFPKSKGHVLVVPKIEIDCFYNVPDAFYNEVFRVAKLISPAIEKAVNAKRIGLSVHGLEIPHFHLHIVPLFNGEELGNKSVKEDFEVLNLIGEEIIKELKSNLA